MQKELIHWLRALPHIQKDKLLRHLVDFLMQKEHQPLLFRMDHMLRVWVVLVMEIMPMLKVMER
jgi:hypothetical protein